MRQTALPSGALAKLGDFVAGKRPELGDGCARVNGALLLVGRGDFHLLQVGEDAHFYGKSPGRVGAPVFFAKRREQLNREFARVLLLLLLRGQVSSVESIDGHLPNCGFFDVP